MMVRVERIETEKTRVLANEGKRMQLPHQDIQYIAGAG